MTQQTGILQSIVYFSRQVYNSQNDIWELEHRMFSEEALHHITRCLVSGGPVVFCPFKNVIYAVAVPSSVTISVRCHDGEVSCHLVSGNHFCLLFYPQKCMNNSNKNILLKAYDLFR